MEEIDQILSSCWKVIHLAETDSTNTYLREHAEEIKKHELVVVSTDFQSAGRGQRGNSWESECNKNLLFSIRCRPLFLPANKQFLLSEIMSLSVKESLEQFQDDFTIKWPNDIYWKEKKIGGILIENDLIGKNISQCILGNGLNINQNLFTSNAPNPVSLKQITGKAFSCKEILISILNRFESYYQSLQAEQFEMVHQKYHDALFRQYGFYSFQDPNGSFKACIDHVEPSGLLVLKDESGNLRSYAFKEVSYLL